MKYFIHIGPPKTATTSLQHYFIENKIPNICYGGILQPRKNKDTTPCATLYKNIKRNKLDYSLNSLNQFNSDKICFLSEEMFLVNSKYLSWKEKIYRLHEIVSPYQPNILIVLRDPEQAIRSYYREIYHVVNHIKIRNINAFAKSIHCEIYNYEFLINSLKDLGFNKIKVLSFEKLIKGKYKIKDVFDINNYTQIKLNKKNTTNKDANKSDNKTQVNNNKKYLFLDLRYRFNNFNTKRIEKKLNSKIKPDILDEFNKSYLNVLNNYIR